MHHFLVKDYIRRTIPVLYPKYAYLHETCMNPAYENIAQKPCPLNLNAKRIFVLRSDFILATGIKNAYEKRYNYTELKDMIATDLHQYINWSDRYGHPSLAIPEGTYTGGVIYAGYLCRRTDHLQVYLSSGRFERNDLNDEQTLILEAYIALQFQQAYGPQEIIFIQGASDTYHATFFHDDPFPQKIPRRQYDETRIQEILSPFQHTRCAL